MPLWGSNSRNTQRDIVIDSVILFVMALAYFLQIIHILIVGSTDGIPAYFVFFIGFFCNQSGANCVLLNFLPWSTEKSHFGRLIGRGGRRGAQALDADLGTAEVTLHLIYSVMLTVVATKYPLNGIESAGVFAAPNGVFVIITIHYLLFVSTTLGLTLLKTNRSPQTIMGVDALIGASGFVNTWMSLLFVILQFFPQVTEFRLKSGSPGSLSLLSLGLRALGTLAVAVRWFQRLGTPGFEEGDKRVSLSLWYRWGWLPFNYVIEGIGCALVVGMYLWAGWTGATLNIADEETQVVNSYLHSINHPGG